jgi:hypothetical protein
MDLNSSSGNHAAVDREGRLENEVSMRRRLWHEEADFVGRQTAEASAVVARCYIEPYDGLGKGA